MEKCMEHRGKLMNSEGRIIDNERKNNIKLKIIIKKKQNKQNY